MFSEPSASMCYCGVLHRLGTRMLSYVFVCVLVLSFHALAQTSYYVSSDGSDNNLGTSSSAAWKTIEKVNSTHFGAGDQILFRRGDEFFGKIQITQSGSIASPITVGSYGSSARKPTITGAVHLSGWSLYKGFIYAVQAPYFVKNLFCGGVQMTLARYPNSGFLFVGTTNGTTTLSANELNQASGYWTNTNIRLRTTRFTFETRTVSSYSGTTLSLSSSATYPIETGWGFYMDNKLEELDIPGEWYCDPSTNTVYFYPPSGADPNGLSIEASVLDYGVNISQSNITVSNLEFRCQSQVAIRFSDTPGNIQLLSNEIFGQLVNGIQIDGSSAYCVIDGNTIRNANGCGISIENTQWTTISNNIVKNIGLVQGYGISATNGMTGIFLRAGSHYTIRGNTIDSVGYIGIRPDGSYNLVENNVLTNTMLRLADGGALYCYSELPSINFGNTWRNNIIVDVLGNLDGAPQSEWKDANGIYLDHACRDMLAEGNTVIRAGSVGLFMQFNSYRNTIRNNLFYDCGRNPGGYVLQIIQDTTKYFGQNVIVNNVFYPLDSVETLVMIQEKNGFCHIPGTLDSNYYCDPYNNLPIRLQTYTSQWNTNDLSLDQWKAYSGQDNHSTGLFTRLHPFVPTDISAPNLIPNGQFQTHIAGWSSWNQNSQVQYTVDGGLDGGCLKFRLFGTTPTPYGIAISNTFGVTKGEWYQLTFSARAPYPGQLTATARQHHPPYTPLHTLTVPIGPERKDYTSYLAVDTTDAQVRIDFAVRYPDSVLFLDNVVFRLVKGGYVPPDVQSPIFVNKSDQQTTFDIGNGSFRDIVGNTVLEPISLAPYSSKILIRDASPDRNPTEVKTQPSEKPKEFMLYQNYPNPFNPSTTIKYALPASVRVRLTIYDSLGQIVGVLVDGIQQAGEYRVTFTNHALATGVYFYRLTAGGFTQTLKLLIVK